MATQRKEISPAELTSLVRDVLRKAAPEMLTLDEVRETLADDEAYGVSAVAQELAEVLNALIVAREAVLCAGETGTPAFAAESRARDSLG